MIFVKNLEKISNVNLKIVEFLNKAVEVTEVQRLVSPQIILSEIQKKCTLIKKLEYFSKKKQKNCWTIKSN